MLGAFLYSHTTMSMVLFFALCVVHKGVHQARKTYVLDVAGGNKRADYVSVSNTLIGVVLLVVGGVSGVIAQFSSVAVLLFSSASSLFAAFFCRYLKNVSN